MLSLIFTFSFLVNCSNNRKKGHVSKLYGSYYKYIAFFFFLFSLIIINGSVGMHNIDLIFNRVRGSGCFDFHAIVDVVPFRCNSASISIYMTSVTVSHNCMEVLHDLSAVPGLPLKIRLPEPRQIAAHTCTIGLPRVVFLKRRSCLLCCEWFCT